MRRRLDLALVERGLAPSRERAQALVLAGRVFVDGRRVDKSGVAVTPTSRIEVRGPDHSYVGRGGLKLEHALRAFGLDVRGAVCLDLGAGTGGFTDCLLQHGARKVYAVDVGYGQLDLRLRADPRVVVLERTHARDLKRNIVPDPLDVACADVSFISLTRALPPVVPLLRPRAPVVALVKPPFEAGRGVAKRGVVRDPEVHRHVIRTVADALAPHGLGAVAVTPSPIRGERGNVEFFLLLRRDAAPELTDERIARAVEEAREIVRGGGCR
ncbi:MAG: TlyA family RNA methyltransferase [Armatimonadota bacterium]|nr:TlyA family RNA methyltransferase [Armatimonadota bacterium]MDR5697237.1 TlyA family RNA methyltransferase [Armatimonadota bacterium]